MGQYTKVEPLYQRSLKMYEVRLGKDHPYVADYLNNLAIQYNNMGQYAKAEPLFQRSLKIHEAKQGKDHLDVAFSLNTLAGLYYSMGKYAKAEPLYERSLAIREARLGKDHPDVANSLNNLAELYRVTGQYAKAEPLYKRSLEIREAKLGKDHPNVATSLHNLALMYQAMGQYAKAQPLYQRSLKIHEAKLGKDHPDVAAFLTNLALLYDAMGQYAKAEPLYQRSLAIREARLSKDHPDVAVSLNNLALLYYALGQYAKAEPLYQRSLKIKEAKLPKDHPSVARALNNLASLYRDLGQYAKAVPQYQRSLEIMEAKLSKDHPTVAAYLTNLATLYARNDGDLEKASLLFDRARRGARRHIASVLPALSDADKAAFFPEHRGPAGPAVVAVARVGPQEGRRAGGAVGDVAAQRQGRRSGKPRLLGQLLSRQSSDPALDKRARRLLAVRQELARLTFATPPPGQEKQRILQIEELTGKEQELARSLRQAGSKAVLPDWVELADLRKALPADAVLIDVAHFRVFDFKAKRGKHWKPAHYAAWVTPKSGPVRLIDLGPAEKIDEAVKQFRQTMQQANKRIKDQGEEKAEQAVREHLATRWRGWCWGRCCRTSARASDGW